MTGDSQEEPEASDQARFSEDYRVESLQRIPEVIFQKNHEDFSRPLPGLGEDRLRGYMELRESGRRKPDLKSTD